MSTLGDAADGNPVIKFLPHKCNVCGRNLICGTVAGIGYAEGEHVNRGRDTPIFCRTLQVLDMSILGDAADVNPVIKFLPHKCNVCGRNLITVLYRIIQSNS